MSLIDGAVLNELSNNFVLPNISAHCIIILDVWSSASTSRVEEWQRECGDMLHNFDVFHFFNATFCVPLHVGVTNVKPSNTPHCWDFFTNVSWHCLCYGLCIHFIQSRKVTLLNVSPFWPIECLWTRTHIQDAVIIRRHLRTDDDTNNVNPDSRSVCPEAYWYSGTDSIRYRAHPYSQLIPTKFQPNASARCDLPQVSGAWLMSPLTPTICKLG